MKLNKLSLKTPLFIAVTGLSLLLPTPLGAENKRNAYAAAAKRSSEATDIYSSTPLAIEGRFRIFALQGTTEGTYRYMKASAQDYREEFETAEFNELTVHNGGGLYTTRSADLEPLPFAYLRELIYAAHGVSRSAPVSKVTNSVQNGHPVNCFEYEWGTNQIDSFRHQTCFDVDTGVLTSWEYQMNSDVHRFEFSNFSKQDGKYSPMLLRRYHNSKLLAELTVAAITHGPIDGKLFDVPKNAVLQNCKRFTPADVEYHNKYFEIRSKYKGGSVVVAGSLDNRGRVGISQVQQSGGSEMDAAAVDALKEVRFHPAKCDGTSVPSLFRLQIWFSPALHADDFQSFLW